MTTVPTGPSEIWRKIRRNASRPLPDLLAFVWAKLLSRLWARHLGSVGRRFHVSRGTRIVGADRVHVGHGFYMGPSLRIEAVGRSAGERPEPVIRIGDNVIGSDFIHVSCATAVTIGDGVLLGSRVHITDHADGRHARPPMDAPGLPPVEPPLSAGTPVVIGRNVWIGDAVVVLPGVTIGEGSIVGANSVVRRSLPAHVIAVGDPARAFKRYDARTATWRPLPVTA